MENGIRRSRFSDERLTIVKEGQTRRKVADVVRAYVRAYGITERMYYRWKAKCSGLELSELQRLRQFKDESRCLKRIATEPTTDNESLKPVISRKWQGLRPSGTPWAGGKRLRSGGHRASVASCG